MTTLTIRLRRYPAEPSSLLHWRDPAKVATAAGVYDVIPAGEFQPASVALWDRRNDFDLWRNIVREYSEELLNTPEHDGTRSKPINYNSWPLYRELGNAQAAGSSACSRPSRTRSNALNRQLTTEERKWLRVRSHFREHQYELAVSAARDYPKSTMVEGTPLLSTPLWLPDQPIPLDHIQLRYAPDQKFAGITGTEPVVHRLLPVGAGGARYHTYSDAVAALAPPRIFENRSTYRLLHADLQSSPHMVFGHGNYSDGIDVGDATAHEFTAATLGEITTQDLRAAIGNPCDPARRPVNVALSTLTLRHDHTTGAATFPLHCRDSATVGHAGNMYQVLPVGIFQPAGEQPWNVDNDFSLWRSIVRELAEELCGQTEDYETHRGPIDYGAWPFAEQLTQALNTAEVHAFCVGIGVDPLTFATDILTVVTIDAPLYDELFGMAATSNTEGSIIPAVPFTAEIVEQYTSTEPTQAAGAGLLRLAWRDRPILLA